MPKKAPKPKPDKVPRTARKAGAKTYERIRERATAANLEASRSARDIGPDCPPVENRERRIRTMASLLEFLSCYFPGTFPIAWSADHLEVVATLHRVIEAGGQFALAMPRGGGKSSITERSILWAVLSGRRRFVVDVAANESFAVDALSRIKAELEYNALLAADFPRECYPIRRLESQPRRCAGQLFSGERTGIVWKKNSLTLPTMPGPDNLGCGAVIRVAGISGAIRGLSHVDSEGRTVRPDLLLIDDPQDRESARSVTQTSERIALANGDMLGLAGPGKRIAALCTCTVIYKNDFSDQLLDRDKSPAWSGHTYKMIYKWPERDDLWQRYLELRREGQQHGGDPNEAIGFYRANQAEMDRGAVVAWPQRFEPGELSAVQHCYNLRQDRGEDVFMSEYQNDPVAKDAGSLTLDPVAIAARVNGFARQTAPPEVERVTAFIDVGQYVLWSMVCGWSESFDCNVLDYGPFPEQRTRVFLARNASPTMLDLYPSAGGDEAIIYAGLTDLVENLVRTEWRRSDGATLKLARIGIDSGWNNELVRLFIRQSKHKDILVPTKGFGLGPAQTAIADYHRRPGEKLGDGWIMGVAGPDRLRLLRFDSNFHKSRVASMLTRGMGSKGGVTLFGSKPTDHELLALHLASEYPTRHEAKGNAVDVWSRLPDRDNHLLDALVGNAVAASFEGLSPLAAIGGARAASQPRKRVSFAEMQAQRRR